MSVALPVLMLRQDTDGGGMLDAYIIDRIRKERERREQHDRRIPLHIENHVERPPEREKERPDDGHDRGSVIIDFQV